MKKVISLALTLALLISCIANLSFSVSAADDKTVAEVAINTVAETTLLEETFNQQDAAQAEYYTKKVNYITSTDVKLDTYAGEYVLSSTAATPTVGSMIYKVVTDKPIFNFYVYTKARVLNGDANNYLKISYSNTLDGEYKTTAPTSSISGAGTYYKGGAQNWTTTERKGDASALVEGFTTVYIKIEMYQTNTTPSVLNWTALNNLKITAVAMPANVSTVTFNSNGGTEVAPAKTGSGNITLPIAPVKADNKFLGWCRDEALTQAFDGTGITSSMTVFAKWGAVPNSTGELLYERAAFDSVALATDVNLINYKNVSIYNTFSPSGSVAPISGNELGEVVFQFNKADKFGKITLQYTGRAIGDPNALTNPGALNFFISKDGVNYSPLGGEYGKSYSLQNSFNNKDGNMERTTEILQEANGATKIFIKVTMKSSYTDRACLSSLKVTTTPYEAPKTVAAVQNGELMKENFDSMDFVSNNANLIYSNNLSVATDIPGKQVVCPTSKDSKGTMIYEFNTLEPIKTIKIDYSGRAISVAKTDLLYPYIDFYIAGEDQIYTLLKKEEGSTDTAPDNFLHEMHTVETDKFMDKNKFYLKVVMKSFAGSWTALDYLNVTATSNATAIHTLTFLADEKVVKTVQVEDGKDLQAADMPAVPEKAGFTGKWEFALEDLVGITSDLEIRAIYTPVLTESYTVTFNSNSGSAVDAITTTTGAITLPTAPTKEGYTFGGWYTDEALTTIFDGTGVTANITVYAKWSPVIIEYMLGDVNNDTSINVNDVLMVLQHVTSKITLADKAFTAADVNKDNSINVNDAMLILQKVTGKISGFNN